VGNNGRANTLQLADTTTGTTEMIDSNPGHGLALRPGPRSSSARPTLTYVCKTDPAHWVVKEFDLETKATTVLMDALAGSEDLAWDPMTTLPDRPAQRVFMAKGPQLFTFSNGQWAPAGSFTSAGIDRITRLAMNPNPMPSPQDRLVFVAEPVSK